MGYMDELWPIEGQSFYDINDTDFLSFLWRVHQGAGVSLSHTRGTVRS